MSKKVNKKPKKVSSKVQEKKTNKESKSNTSEHISQPKIILDALRKTDIIDITNIIGDVHYSFKTENNILKCIIFSDLSNNILKKLSETYIISMAQNNHHQRQG